MVRMLLPMVLVVVAVLVVLALTRRPRAPGPIEGPDGPSGRAEALRRARAQLRRAEERYAVRLEAAEAALARARLDEEVLRLGPVLLCRCSVLVSGREHALTEGTSFTLTADGRLVVVGDGWEEVVQVDPADRVRAEGLVAAGRAAAREVDVAQQERAARVEQAWTQLEAARADRAEVDAARMTVEDIEGA